MWLFMLKSLYWLTLGLRYHTHNSTQNLPQDCFRGGEEWQDSTNRKSLNIFPCIPHKLLRFFILLKGCHTKNHGFLRVQITSEERDLHVFCSTTQWKWCIFFKKKVNRWVSNFMFLRMLEACGVMAQPVSVSSFWEPQSCFDAPTDENSKRSILEARS